MSNYNIFTIGHSNHSFDKFLHLLKRHFINVVVDVRSNPYSRYSSHFNKDVLQNSLNERGLKYLFLGDALGGRPKDNHFYDDEGYVLYNRLADSKTFQEGIDRLLKGVSKYRIALLCSEEDPNECHRHLLIGRVLSSRGINVAHIRGDGSLQSDVEILKDLNTSTTNGQTGLFYTEVNNSWKSTQSVFQRKVHVNSSKR